jgi:hypothetical protein
MNEEMTSTGGKTYAEEAKRKGEIHYAALESDRGVMSPLGFSFDTDSLKLEKLQSLASWFAPYNIRDFDKGGGGSDIAPLKALVHYRLAIYLIHKDISGIIILQMTHSNRLISVNSRWVAQQ